MQRSTTVVLALAALVVWRGRAAAVANDEQTPAAFSASAEIAAGSGTQAVVVADVDGDGHDDVIAANNASGGISILFGTGTALEAAMNIPTAFGPSAVAVGHVDDNGLLDIIVAHQAVSRVRVLLQGPTPREFTLGPAVATGDGPEDLAVADLDGDGALDVVTADFASFESTISLLRGLGDGDFEKLDDLPSVPLDGSLSGGPAAIALADVLGGDGVLDILVANGDGDSIGVLRGLGEGAFAEVENFGVGNSPVDLVVGDITGDGLADVITADAENATISILRGVAGGGLMQAVGVAVGSTPRSVVLGDFNLDGRADIAVAEAAGATGHVSILRGRADGALQSIQTFPIQGRGPESIATGRFDGDEKPDLVTANADALMSTTSLSVLLNETEGDVQPTATPRDDPTPTPTMEEGVICGNGITEADEQCDDENNYGGDGCAANCTFESDAFVFLGDESTSQSLGAIQTGLFRLGYTLSGAVVLTHGAPIDRAIYGADGVTHLLPGEMPAVMTASKNTGTVSTSGLPGLGCVCLRREPAFTCGGVPLVPGTEAQRCDPEANECTFPSDECRSTYGSDVLAAGIIGCDGISDLNYIFAGDSITSVNAFERSGGLAAEGARIAGLTRLHFIQDDGGCVVNVENPENGADGLPCTDDDPVDEAWTSTIEVLTSGTANAVVRNVNDIAGKNIDGESMCGANACDVTVTGQALGCEAFLENGAEGLCLASASAELSQPLLGDVVVTSRLCGVSPDAPTRTPTPAPVVTATNTIAPPPTLGLTPVPGSPTPTIEVSPGSSPTRTMTPPATQTATPVCLGDCDTSGSVTSADLRTGVEVALGERSLTACESLDADHDGVVTIDELTRAVLRKRDDCTGS